MSTVPAAPTTPDAVIGRRVVARVIDDALVLAFAVGITLAVESRIEVAGGGVLQLGGFPDPGYQQEWMSVPTLAVLVAVVALLLGTLAYYAGASAANGRTPGRAVTGLRVVRADGEPAPWRLLLGRELLRTSLLALAVALTWPVASALFGAAGQVGDTELAALVDAMARCLPFFIVGAGWIGATLVDPLGRAPHDRLARTLVIDGSNTSTPDNAS